MQLQGAVSLSQSQARLLHRTRLVLQPSRSAAQLQALLVRWVPQLRPRPASQPSAVRLVLQTALPATLRRACTAAPTTLAAELGAAAHHKQH